MKKVFKTEKANIIIERISARRNRITVEPFDKGLYVPYSTTETELSTDEIEEILKNSDYPIGLPAAIVREKEMRNKMKWWILAYVSQDEFKHKRILDFGCGSGSSTMILAQMFPDSDIIGIDISDKKISTGKLRAKRQGFDNINLLVSPDANSLPENVGYFDFINLTGVYEHLLPYERETLLPKMWNDALKKNGILFINQTPNRCFPIVKHTTEYLPLVNYLPDKLALIYVRNFGKKRTVFKNCSWETLLKRGIRGGSVREIIRILSACSHKPILMIPNRLGVKDRVVLWYKQGRKRHIIKKIYFTTAESLYILTGIAFLPNLSLAIRKI